MIIEDAVRRTNFGDLRVTYSWDSPDDGREGWRDSIQLDIQYQKGECYEALIRPVLVRRLSDKTAVRASTATAYKETPVVILREQATRFNKTTFREFEDEIVEMCNDICDKVDDVGVDTSNELFLLLSTARQFVQDARRR